MPTPPENAEQTYRAYIRMLNDLIAYYRSGESSERAEMNIAEMYRLRLEGVWSVHTLNWMSQYARIYGVYPPRPEDVFSPDLDLSEGEMLDLIGA